jgi:DNA-binding transcriptional regulator of glucitol operon
VPRQRWTFLLQPRWLCWHAFAVLATAGMLWLGDWQLRRAESGNELSWAYTFEWPLFAAFAIYFWIRSIREELRQAAGHADVSGLGAGSEPPQSADAYAARLRAEVRGHGKWHGLR